jgi:hypothetical protein
VPSSIVGRMSLSMMRVNLLACAIPAGALPEDNLTPERGLRPLVVLV